MKTGNSPRAESRLFFHVDVVMQNRKVSLTVGGKIISGAAVENEVRYPRSRGTTRSMSRIAFHRYICIAY